MTAAEIHEANARWLAEESRQLRIFEEWPEVVLEDVLDAEVIGE